MKNVILSIFLLLSFNFSFAQVVIINDSNIQEGKAILLSLSGEKVILVDSITILQKNTIQFKLDNDHSGIYRLTFSNSKSIYFIYEDDEDVELEVNISDLAESIEVIESRSNKIYYDFIRLNKTYKSKTELLQLVLAHYPKDDDYFQTTKEKLLQIQEEYLQFVNITSQADPNTFIARYVKSSQLPVVESKIPFDQQLNYLKMHALDNVDFNDEELIYSDAFTNKTIEYLTYYSKPQLPLELLEKEFMVAVDSVLNKAKVKETVYQHVVEYLIDGFKNFGFDNVINYIVENYVIKDDLCLNEKLENSLERRIEQTRNFKIGSIVPDIIISDSSDAKFGLDHLTSEKILILFYASWCTHCQSLIQQLIVLYENQKEKQTEVVAVSIDTSKAELINFLNKNNAKWIHVADLKGWNGKAPSDYFLYATPTMFLIDKEKKIIAKPLTVDELKSWFR